MEKIPKYFSIGCRISSLRSQSGLSQAKFGKSIGLSQSAYSELELGNKEPTMPVLLAIEYVHGVCKEWVMAGDEPKMRARDGFGTPIQTYPINNDTDRHRKLWINKLNRIFDEGDNVKVDTVKGMLKAFDPGEKK